MFANDEKKWSLNLHRVLFQKVKMMHTVYYLLPNELFVDVVIAPEGTYKMIRKKLVTIPAPILVADLQNRVFGVRS